MLRVLQSAHDASYACPLGLVVPRLTPPRVEPEAAGLAAVPVQRIADAVGAGVLEPFHAKRQLVASVLS